MPEDDLLSVEEVAGLLGLSVATIRRKCASGDLKAEKVGRQWVIDRKSLPSRPRSSRPSPPRPTTFDLDTALVHLRSRDLSPTEVWVPDILLHDDQVAAEADLKSEAAERLQNEGPFDPVMEVPVPKTALFIRAASYPTLVDRLAYHACVLALGPRMESRRLDCVFSARLSKKPKYLLENGKNAFLDWQAACRKAIDDGFTWMVRTDIVSYFDNIQHRLLFSDLDALGGPAAAARVLKRMLGEWSHHTSVGIPQGPDASRLLGNHYLHVVDEAMCQGEWTYLRYMDDIAILGRSRHDVQLAIQTLQVELRRRGLTLASKKTKLLEGADAKNEFDEPELAQAQYHFVAKLKSARRLLKKILRQSLKDEGNVVVRWARFALFRLRALRDSDVLKKVFDRLEDLAPVASIVAEYLLPWLDRASVERRLGAFLNDPTRNTSPYLSTWLLAAALERRKSIPEPWIDYARRTCQDKNQPVYLRAVAANLMALGGHPADLAWLERELRSEFDPTLLRGYLVALARAGHLTGAIISAATGRRPELAVTGEYLKGRQTLPSLVYRDQSVPITK